MSAIDSELKTGRPGISDLNWRGLLWGASAIVGVFAVSFLFPSHWLVAMSASVLFVWSVALLDRVGAVKVGLTSKSMTHRRIEAYYQRGRALYSSLASDSRIASEEVRRIVADEWVNPTTDYLRGTLGDSKATYFLAIRGEEPEPGAVMEIGYEKALARTRIMIRLERLRQLTGTI